MSQKFGLTKTDKVFVIKRMLCNDRSREVIVISAMHSFDQYKTFLKNKKFDKLHVRSNKVGFIFDTTK